jgi:hypothetical protein
VGFARKRIVSYLRHAKDRADFSARPIKNLKKNVIKSAYSVADWRSVAGRAGAAHGKAGASSALAAKITDCSHRRLVFIVHLLSLRHIWPRYCFITLICGISLSPRGKHLEGV